MACCSLRPALPISAIHLPQMAGFGPQPPPAWALVPEPGVGKPGLDASPVTSCGDLQRASAQTGGPSVSPYLGVGGQSQWLR